MNEVGPIAHSDDYQAQSQPSVSKKVWGGETVEKLMASDLEKIDKLDIVPSEVAALLTSPHPEMPHELKLRATLFLSKIEGGYEDVQLRLMPWQGTAAKVTLIFLKTFTTIGEGKAGVVERGKTEVVDLETQRPSVPEELVSKKAKSDAQFDQMVQGDGVVRHLVEKHGGGKSGIEGIVDPFRSLDTKTRTAYGASYIGNIDEWEKANNPSPKKVLLGFISALRGLAVMQKEGVIHTDLKFQNILAKAGEPIQFAIGDFDGVFMTIAPDDKRTDQQLIDYLDKVLFNRDGTPYNPEFTPEFTPRAEMETLRSLLDELRKRNPPPTRAQILSLSAELNACTKKIQMYQMGCAILGMVTGADITYFFGGHEEREVKSEFPLPNYIYGAILEKDGIPEELHEQLTDLFIAMTNPDPAERPTTNKVLVALSKLLKKMSD